MKNSTASKCFAIMLVIIFSLFNAFSTFAIGTLQQTAPLPQSNSIENSTINPVNKITQLDTVIKENITKPEVTTVKVASDQANPVEYVSEPNIETTNIIKIDETAEAVQTIEPTAESNEIKIVEKNIYDSQITENTKHNIEKLILENLPEYMYESVGINEITKEQAPVKLDNADAENLNSFTTINADGTNTLYLFNEPIKYIDNTTGEIKFIDNSVIPNSIVTETITPILTESSNVNSASLSANSSVLTSSYTNAANCFSVNMPSSINQGVLLEYGNLELSLLPASPSTSIATLRNVTFRGTTEQVVEYLNVFGDGIHLQYIPINNGIKENIVLDSYTGINTFNFIIDAGDYYPLYTEGEAIPFADPSTDEITFIVGQVDARDSYLGDDTDGHFTLNNYLSLTAIKDGKYALTVTVDPVFLANENTVYPVIIDPSITISSGNMQDTTVYSGIPDRQTFYSSAYNIVGYHGSSYGSGTAFIQATNIDDFAYILPGNVTNATYRVYEGSGKTNSVRVRVGSPRYSWTQSSITYNNKSRIDPVSFLTVSSSGWKNFDITTLVKDWLAYADDNGVHSAETGFALEAVDSNSSSLHFCSVNHSNYTPSITITYITSGTTFDVNAVYNSTNDTKFRAFGYLIHGISPQFKLTIHTAGTYNIETLNSISQFGYGFDPQDTQLELLDSSFNRVSFNDDISSTNHYSHITVDLTAGTYYLRVYNSSGTRTNIRCYVIVEKNNELSFAYHTYADLAKDFYKVANASSTYNCLAYVFRDYSQWIDLSTNETAAVNQLLSAGCTKLTEPTNNCIVLYGLLSDPTTHVTIVENGVVKAKLGHMERVRHSSINAYYHLGYGMPIGYFTDPAL